MEDNQEQAARVRSHGPQKQRDRRRQEQERRGHELVQQLLLQFVAAPLLLLAAPVTLLVRAVGPDTRRLLLVVLHSRVLRVITFPLIGWFLFAAVNWGWHLAGDGAIYDYALEVEWVHWLQHGMLFGAALLFGSRSWPWIRSPGAFPTPLACSTCSWPCPRTRSWAWRS